MQTEVLPVAETVLRGISFSAAAAVRSPGAFEKRGSEGTGCTQNVSAGESVHAAEGDCAET